MNKNEEKLQREPFKPTIWEILGKVSIWLIVAILLSALVFFIYMFSQQLFKNALASLTSTTWINTTNPMLSIIIALIWFIGSFIWTIIIGWVYNLLFSNRYYDLWKMFIINITINSILFIVSLPLYLLFNGNIQILLLIMVFHILLSSFLTFTSYDVISNPNYSAEYLIGYSIWLFISLFTIWLIFKIIDILKNPGAIWYALVLPFIITYTLLPLINWIWEQIYYKFYEMWNDFLYIPSIDEILVDEEEIEDINVEV